MMKLAVLAAVAGSATAFAPSNLGGMFPLLKAGIDLDDVLNVSRIGRRRNRRRLVLGRRLSLVVGRCHRNHIMTSARNERLLTVLTQEDYIRS
jgi:hypothetical protein